MGVFATTVPLQQYAAPHLPPLSSCELQLLRIARLNSDAITLLQRGDVKSASNTFVYALEELKTICEESDESSQDNDDDTKCYCDVYFLGIVSGCSYLPISVSTASSPSQRTLCHESVLYDKAFLLTSDVPCDTAATAAVLLFNTGLLHHTKAVASGVIVDFKKAIRFYQKAATLIAQEELAQFSSTMAVVMAAVLHNLADCHLTAFVDSISAACCQRELSDLLEWMRKHAVVSQSDMEFFSTSLLFANIRMRECRVASAA